MKVKEKSDRKMEFRKWALLFICICLILSSISFLGGLYIGKVKGIPFVAKEKRWAIGMYEGNSPYNLQSMKGVKNPIICYKDVKDIEAEAVADPFLVKEGSNWYMFFEVVNKKTKKGEIGFAIRGDDFGKWIYRRIIISETFHLSYPYVFKCDGDWYMIPETYQARSIRLYRAKDFPADWEFIESIISGDEYLDSSIFWYKNKWWLFTSVRKNESVLRLFYSESLSGKWKEHPLSPVVNKSPKTARSGGRIVFYDGRIIRFSQDDYLGYGYQNFAYEVLKISETEYSENIITDNPVIRGSGEGWNSDGMHHVDAHKIAENRWIASVDGKGSYLKFGFKH